MELTLAQILNLLQYAGTVKEILDVANSNADITGKLKTLAGPVFKILEGLGSKLFPKAAPALHAVGGAIAAYDPNVTKWIQGACNEILGSELAKPLAVDGIYGPMTAAAVTQLQTKLGLPKVDGLAGRLTQAAIDAWYAAKQPKTT